MDVIGKRRALGRGLGALIPGAPAPQEPAAETFVSLSAIQPNPMQPRQTFSEAGIDELARSVREKGILQPLLVRRTSRGFELIAGERRFRAAQRIGMEQVPVVVREAADDELLELALIENLQREDLNPLEEARAYRRLIDELHLTQEDIARRVSKDRSTIANALRLLQLPDEVKNEIERGALTAGHARALAGAASDTERLTLAREVVTKRLSVRQTEKLAKRSARPISDAEHRAVEERLTELLGTRVRLTSRRSGAGKIEIEYYSPEELNGLIDRLSTAQAAA
jgi:ParB family transcriptional regulator, chromosome partitioning protein